MRRRSSAKVPSSVFFAPHALMLTICVFGNMQIALVTDLGADFADIYGSQFYAYDRVGALWFALVLGGSTIASYCFNRRVERPGPARVERKPVALRGAAGIGLALLALLLLADNGNFVYREEYLVTSGPAGIFVGMALMGLPMVAAMQKRRAYGFILLAMSIVVAFSNATRVGALIPMIYLLTKFLTGNEKLSSRAIASLCLLSLLLYGLALTSRAITPHGLVPYLGFYVQHPGAVFVSVLSVFENFSSNYINFLATLAVNHGDFTLSYLSIIVDPRGGAAAGWNDVSPQYRIHPFVPYSGYAELARISFLLSIIFVVAVLAFYNYLAIRVWRAPPREKIFYILALLSLLVFFVLMYSYNARSGFRWLYLAMVLYAGATGLRLFRSWKSFHRRIL